MASGRGLRHPPRTRVGSFALLRLVLCICRAKGAISASLDGSTIYVEVAAKSEFSADCICAVDDIVTELSGLEKGGYTLIYNYQSSDENITQEVEFDFSALLNIKVDFERTIMYRKTDSYWE